MFIRYYTKNGVEYACLQSSSRIKDEISSKYGGNLGRVIDKEKGIFKNRKRGYYRYTIEDGYSEASAKDVAIAEERQNGPEPEERSYGNERMPIDFGDAFFLDWYMKELNLTNIVRDLIPHDADTVMSLLFYKVLTDQKASMHALTWWRGNYASMLFPLANLKSQHISLVLEDLGSEQIQHQFFDHYISLLYGKNGATGILIDSTGIPNATKMQVTQLSNHNGDINVEVRLIYVIDRKNGMPIYFRYVQGNIIDVSTLITTFNEMKQYGIDISYAIMDAGYFSEENVRELFENEVPFITRLAPNRVLFKEVVGNNNESISDLQSARYAVNYGGRLVYLKRVARRLYDHDIYVFIGIDAVSHNAQSAKTMLRYLSDGIDPDEIDRQMMRLGLFVIVSSEALSTEEVLPLYYTRQQVEQVFDVTKNYVDILPIRVDNEMTFRGHLLLCFIATAILQRLQSALLAKRKKGDKVNIFEAFMQLRNQKCKVFDKALVPYEPCREDNEIYRMFNLNPPKLIEREDERSEN